MTRTNIFAAASFSLALVFTASCTIVDGEENETKETLSSSSLGAEGTSSDSSSSSLDASETNKSSSSLGAGGTSSDSGNNSGTLCVDDEEKECILLSYVKSLGAKSCSDLDAKTMDACPNGYTTITDFGSGGACVLDMGAFMKVCMEGEKMRLTPDMCEEMNEDDDYDGYAFVYADSCPPSDLICGEQFPFNMTPIHLSGLAAAYYSCEQIYDEMLK